MEKAPTTEAPTVPYAQAIHLSDSEQERIELSSSTNSTPSKEPEFLQSSSSKPVAVREKWPTRRDFYLSCAGSFIGLGNVWRFPYLCYENGGAVFFIPYLIFLFLAGIPIFFLEVSVGQYTSEGGITAWTILAPITTGIGWGSIVLTTVINTYYIVVLAWALYYLCASMASPEHLNQIWNNCDNEWNTAKCTTFDQVLNMTRLARESNETGAGDEASAVAGVGKTTITPIEEYWENEVLKIDDQMSWATLTDINWSMFICVLASWIVCYFCVWRGLKWTSKVVAFTATFPVFMLFVLLIRGVTLEGAMKGIEFFVIPRATSLAKLKETKIWVDAGTQVLYSYALCKGALLSLGSFNKYRTNCYKDVYILSCCNSGMSFVSGFAIFSVLGFMADHFNCEVADVAKSGPGLAFIAFPQAILKMPGESFRPAWAVAFFFMIFLLGLDTQFVGLEAVATSFIDMYPSLRRKGRRELFILGIVLLSLALALPMCGTGGIYLFKLYDYYGASGFCLLFLCASQCLAVSYVYGADKFWNNIRSMVGYWPSKYCYYCWKYLTPLLCAVLTALMIINFKPLKYDRPLTTKYYTNSEETVGWFLASLSILPVLVVFFGKPFIKNGRFLSDWNEVKANFYHCLRAKDQKIQHTVFNLNRSPDDPDYIIDHDSDSKTKMTSQFDSHSTYSSDEKISMRLDREDLEKPPLP